MNSSLKDESMNCYIEDESHLITLEWLVQREYLQNNRLSSWWPSIPRLFWALNFMKNLEKLSLLEWKLRLTDLPPFPFRSCPKLTELHLRLFQSQELEMNEELKNVLRSGFQRLQLLELNWDINSWLVLQKIFT
jgi:hypothetical protein